MKKSILWIFFLMLLSVGCTKDNRNQENVSIVENVTDFELDGFVFGENYQATQDRIKKHQLHQVDRVEFFENREEHKEIFPLADLMETYEGSLFDQEVEVAFHFKNDQFQFLVFQSKVASVEPLVALFSQYYGQPVMRGALFEGEIFQGDNILWRVFDEHESEIGYVSLMPIESATQADDWGAMVTIYPYTANPIIE